MKIPDLILPFKLALLQLLVVFFVVGCENNQEPVKTRMPASVEQKKNLPPPATPTPVPEPITAPPDSLISPDTVESHDRIQKKPEIRTIRRVLNFHKKPLIT
jgi:hypothetical protein